MKTIEQILFDKEINLGKNDGQGYSVKADEPKTVRFETDIIRQKKKDLMQMFVSNPICFNTVNKYVQLTMSADFNFTGADEDVKFFDNFYDNIGNSGTGMDKYDLFAETFRHQFITGDAYQENIFNKRGSKIVDLDIVNPISIDFVRNQKGMILLDDNQNIVGYTQTVPSSQDVPLVQKFNFPTDSRVDNNQLFIPKERITHFKLYKVGDGFDGLGIIEPIYNSSLRKLNSEKGFAEAASRLGSPIITAQIGDSLHEPTPQQVQNSLTEISKVNQKSAFAYPYTTKISLLEPRKPEKLKEYLDYFSQSEITGMGMPAAFATGKGEETNRATLSRQEYLLKLSMKEIIKRTIKVIEEKQIKVIARQYGVNPVKIKWGEIALEEVDAKSTRLAQYADKGLLTPDMKLENYIRDLEGLPKKEGIYQNPNEKLGVNP